MFVFLAFRQSDIEYEKQEKDAKGVKRCSNLFFSVLFRTRAKRGAQLSLGKASFS